MRKSFAYNVLSDVKCMKKFCERMLKMRIVTEHPKFKFCYKCFKQTGR